MNASRKPDGSGARDNHHGIAHTLVLDALFLVLLSGFFFIQYGPRLGFYSDDWDFLSRFANSDNNSIQEYFVSAYDSWIRPRPVQVLYFASLYRMFGLNPSGYHITNSVVLTLAVLLFYFCLRLLNQPRGVSLAIALIYFCLPNYSTDRLWFAASQATLSMALYFLSLLCQLLSLRVSSGHWKWSAVSILSMVASLLAYEVALPLFVLNQWIAWKYSSSDKRKPMIAVFVAALVAIVVFKLMTTERLGAESFLDRSERIVAHAFKVDAGPYEYGFNFRRAVSAHFVQYFKLIPDLISKSTSGSILSGLCLFLLVVIYVFRGFYKAELHFPVVRKWLQMGVFGVICFLLGYGIFLFTMEVGFTAGGMNNRTAIAASAGVAFLLTSVIGLVVSPLKNNFVQNTIFSIGVGAICCGGFWMNTKIASYWVDAYQKQKIVLAEIQSRFPELSSGSSVLLDGNCPYVGPGIVFESYWDLTGALRILYQDNSIRADVLQENSTADPKGVTTLIYVFRQFYPYGENLFVYDHARKRSATLIDWKTSQAYFNNSQRDASSCPPGQEGFGSPMR